MSSFAAAVEARMDALHARVVSEAWMRLFAATTRGMLAIAFIIAGYRKVGGNPFAPGVPTDTPIGDYFDASWRTGEYYWVVGATQIAAGVLLLFPATCLLAAVIYFPIILNIIVLTGPSRPMPAMRIDV